MRRLLLALAYIVAPIPGACRRALPAFAALIFAVSFVVGALSLGGCHSSPINGAALVPASQADVETLFKDASVDRENTAKAIGAVRDDLAATGAQVAKSDAALKALDATAKEIEARPPSGGIPGALVNTLGGSLPPWLDWLVTLGATALGINTTRNASRKKALAKVAAPKPTTPTA